MPAIKSAATSTPSSPKGVKTVNKYNTEGSSSFWARLGFTKSSSRSQSTPSPNEGEERLLDDGSFYICEDSLDAPPSPGGIHRRHLSRKTDFSSTSAGGPLPPHPKEPSRGRTNSRDLARTYSGSYVQPLLCFPQGRGALTTQTVWSFIILYVLVVCCVWVFASTLLTWLHVPEESNEISLTITNAIHLAITLEIVHWRKGSFCDPQGEMNAMTMWEQLEANGADAWKFRQVLLIVPTLLCLFPCQFSEFKNPYIVSINLVLWAASMLGKLPCMNGYRIFGINRTAGIDDDEEDIDDDATPTSVSVVFDLKKDQ